MKLKRVGTGRVKQDAGNVRIFRAEDGALWLRVGTDRGIRESRSGDAVVMAKYKGRVGEIGEKERRMGVDWVVVCAVRVKPSALERSEEKKREREERRERRKRRMRVGKRKRGGMSSGDLLDGGMEEVMRELGFPGE